MSNIKGRMYNGLTGLELKTVILKQLHDELHRQADPAAHLDWAKRMAVEIDRVMSIDDRFRPHITYPVIEWGWHLAVKSDPANGVVKFAFTFKAHTYPVGDKPEWDITVATGVRPVVKSLEDRDKEFPVFDLEAMFGQEYEAPDKLRKMTGLPGTGQKTVEGGQTVNLTHDEASQLVGRASEIVNSF